MTITETDIIRGFLSKKPNEPHQWLTSNFYRNITTEADIINKCSFLKMEICEFVCLLMEVQSLLFVHRSPVDILQVNSKHLHRFAVNHKLTFLNY